MENQDNDISQRDAKDIRWNRVHFLTPLIMLWKAILAILAIVSYSTIQDPNFWANYNQYESGLSFFKAYLLIFALGLLGILLLAILYCYFAWTRIGYSLDDLNVYYKQGIFFKNQRYIRLSRIQTVDIVYPLVGRIFGLGQIKIESAGSSESHITIAFMKEKQLDDLRNTILALMAGVSVQKADSNEENVFSENETDDSSAKEKLGIHDLEFQASRAPEKVVYEIDYKKFIVAIVIHALYSVFLFLFFALLFLTAVFCIVVYFHGAPKTLSEVTAPFMEESLVTKLQMLALPILAIGGIITKAGRDALDKFGYTLKISPDGFRTRSGLTSLVHETIPPNRIHALVIKQSLMWRLLKIWEIETVKAAVSQADADSSKSESFAPLVEIDEIDSLVHLVYKKLSDVTSQEIDREIIIEGLTGTKEGKYFKRVSPVAKFLHPFQYSRMAYCVTENVVLVRRGFLSRKLAIIPHERAQSLGIKQSFIGYKLKVATLSLHLVKINHMMNLACLPISVAKTTLQELSDMSGVKRLAEPNEEWMKRVYKSE
ncbi:PH domain-containing protein [Actinomyces sp. zg-332]|uniref:PH domain-containing protein n=1 Tax=Actinomyces sp. zg-332 TaxID=2708340 RepID=UPI00142228C4|nr:PH domain-containing protein [Actinomyces sp. zg-332]QPK94325.1 PH domain-containing protein [Actinomyces sp. zg-332]